MSLKTVKRDPDPNVIALIERLLERAKNGDILSIGFAYVDDSPPSGVVQLLDARQR